MKRFSLFVTLLSLCLVGMVFGQTDNQPVAPTVENPMVSIKTLATPQTEQDLQNQKLFDPNPRLIRASERVSTRAKEPPVYAGKKYLIKEQKFVIKPGYVTKISLLKWNDVSRSVDGPCWFTINQDAGNRCNDAPNNYTAIIGDGSIQCLYYHADDKSVTVTIRYFSRTPLVSPTITMTPIWAPAFDSPSWATFRTNVLNFSLANNPIEGDALQIPSAVQTIKDLYENDLISARDFQFNPIKDAVWFGYSSAREIKFAEEKGTSLRYIIHATAPAGEVFKMENESENLCGYYLNFFAEDSTSLHWTGLNENRSDYLRWSRWWGPDGKANTKDDQVFVGDVSFNKHDANELFLLTIPLHDPKGAGVLKTTTTLMYWWRENKANAHYVFDAPGGSICINEEHQSVFVKPGWRPYPFELPKVNATVVPFSAPKDREVPRFGQYAFEALRDGKSSLGDSSKTPEAFQALQTLSPSDGLVSSFNSWHGSASPSGAFAGLTGNYITFGLVLDAFDPQTQKSYTFLPNDRIQWRIGIISPLNKEKTDWITDGETSMGELYEKNLRYATRFGGWTSSLSDADKLIFIGGSVAWNATDAGPPGSSNQERLSTQAVGVWMGATKGIVYSWKIIHPDTYGAEVTLAEGTKEFPFELKRVDPIEKSEARVSTMTTPPLAPPTQTQPTQTTATSLTQGTIPSQQSSVSTSQGMTVSWAILYGCIPTSGLLIIFGLVKLTRRHKHPLHIT